MSESNSDERLELTKENVLFLWSKTYNTDGKPDWSHIFRYYSDDIVFQDSIQRIEGIDGFMALCKRLTDRCKELRMDISSILKEDNVIMMDWTMTMMFKKYPSTPIYGSTKLVLNDEGKIAMQRDYYDLWGDIFNGIPWFKKPYRKFMGKKFG
ncbi:MAG TPA: nuclear transport factor 2 family protein [Clostridia bacterium]|nr:nuclear transport factor 2 family protein [Clostridia bacterium]HPQ46378.1 nuclear transport factor 2 family protein [Clostridia bacterium]HRX41206.1 nuclear transport factor 2 family protein [Clostridia bacterium]